MVETFLHVNVFDNEMECIDSRMFEIDKYIFQSIISYMVKNMLQHSSVGCLCVIWKTTKYYWEDFPILLSVDRINLVGNFRTSLKSPISIPIFGFSE